MFRKKVIRENMDNNSFTLKNFKVMTAFNTSLNSPRTRFNPSLAPLLAGSHRSHRDGAMLFFSTKLA
jgi:hypothetical protein